MVYNRKLCACVCCLVVEPFLDFRDSLYSHSPFSSVLFWSPLFLLPSIFPNFNFFLNDCIFFSSQCGQIISFDVTIWINFFKNWLVRFSCDTRYPQHFSSVQMRRSNYFFFQLLPRSNHLLIWWLQSPSDGILLSVGTYFHLKS